MPNPYGYHRGLSLSDSQTLWDEREAAIEWRERQAAIQERFGEPTIDDDDQAASEPNSAEDAAT